MGALNTVAGGLSTFATAMNTVGSVLNAAREFNQDPYEESRKQLRAQQDLALKQLKEKQIAGTKAAQEKAALERSKMAAETLAAEKKRRAALKRAMARQRVSFGGRGIDTSSGSAQAVLLGLYDESDEERQERERLDNIRNSFIDQDLSSQSRINVLQRSQLKEKQRLERILSER